MRALDGLFNMYYNLTMLLTGTGMQNDIKNALQKNKNFTSRAHWPMARLTLTNTNSTLPNFQ